MVYNVVYKKSVSRDLKKLTKVEATRILNQIEKELSKNPESNPSLKGKFVGLRKFRIGDYKIIYAILEHDVIILRIGHRKEVYKKDASMVLNGVGPG
ncbi:MAG: type II toxin-antitoxin system RelE/ParE family toxin [Syntrophaceae bacterium]|nr:type II toxin-antitoxin system RelE/ParE family toxin [Syntrophaceae bacterium]